MKAAMVAGGVVILMAVGGIMAKAGEPDRGAHSRLILIGQVSEPKTIAAHVLPQGRPAIAVSLDPKFFCTIKLDEIVSGQAPWRVGSEVVLLLHSPTQTFLNGNPAGKRYRFTLDAAETSSGDARYTLREAGLEPAVP